MRLLLVSNSYAHKGGYLDHCADEICSLLAPRQQILFIPYAGYDLAQYTQLARERFSLLGYSLASIHESNDPQLSLQKAEAIFVGGGNTFLLLKNMYDMDLLEAMRSLVLAGTPYIGASAGANLAGLTIQTTNDMPIVYPPSLTSLGVLPFNLNPHYIDHDPNSTHMGENRDARIKEFQLMNEISVLALREGALLRVEGVAAYLRGSSGARFFRVGVRPQDFSPGQSLEHLLWQGNVS